MYYGDIVHNSGFVTRAWVKQYYSISNATLHLWISQGRFPSPVKIGPRAVRFRVEDLREFEENCRKGPN